MNTEQGFSLFELLIVLVIIGILARISYPIYTHALIKTHRIEAKIALINLANLMEAYYLANNNSYQDATFYKLHIKDKTEKKFYELSIKSTTDTYLLTAITRFSDLECCRFMLNHLGKKTHIGSSEHCW